MENDKTEEQILRDMNETRSSLTEKLETLEKKVVGTVESATSAVNETVGSIKDSVHETVATVKDTVHETVASVNESFKGGVESVKDALDVQAHVQEHPWLMVGGSVAVGYVLGSVLSPSQRPTYVSQPMHSPPPAPAHLMHSTASSAPAASQQASENFLAPEIAKFKGLALGLLFGAAREWIRSSVPEHVGEKIEQIMDAVTRKAGGDPVPSSDFE